MPCWFGASWRIANRVRCSDRDTENRGDLKATLAGLRDLTATVKDLTEKNRVKVERLIDGVTLTSARADRVLYQADILAGQGV